MKAFNVAALLLLCFSANVCAVPENSKSPFDNVKKATVESLGLEKRLFLTLNTDKARIGAGEQFFIIVKLHVDRVNMKDIVMPILYKNDLSKAEFQEPTQYREKRGDALYDVLEFKASMSGAKTGKYRIGPAISSCVLIVPNLSLAEESEEESVLIELKSNELDLAVSSNGVYIDYIASVFGGIVGLLVGYLIVMRYQRRLVSYLLKRKYDKLKKDNPIISEKEILIKTMRSRHIFKKLSDEIIAKIIQRESISNLDELVSYVSREEKAYMKEVFKKGILRVDRDRMKELNEMK